MIFSSLLFLFIFLPLVLVAYYIVPSKFRNLCLLIVGLIFYAWGEPVYILLMLFTILVDYFSALLINRLMEQSPYKAKAVLICNILINLTLLGYFKYAGFLVETLNGLTGLAFSVPHAVLPIGISFYTFESISYSVDVYRKEAPVMKNPIDFGAYITFFPHLVAGPIVRYKDLSAQILQRNESFPMFAKGCERFLYGLFKKVLLANNLAVLSDKIQFLGASSVLTAWLGALAFTFQIYFDFSGYSDMAIGLAKMFGFEFPENFNYPYVARSASEFWRRWHITLGTWFREYVYIPLGGNRVSTIKLVRNLAIVWVLTGIWHGASWNFALWGAYYAVLIILEKLFLGRILEKIPVFIQWLYGFLVAVFGWVLFAYTDISRAFSALKAMIGFAPLWDSLGLYSLYTFAPLLLLGALCSAPIFHVFTDKLRMGSFVGRAIWAVFMAAGLLLTVGALVDNSYNPFLYTRF